MNTKPWIPVRSILSPHGGPARSQYKPVRSFIFYNEHNSSPINISSGVHGPPANFQYTHLEITFHHVWSSSTQTMIMRFNGSYDAPWASSDTAGSYDGQTIIGGDAAVSASEDRGASSGTIFVTSSSNSSNAWASKGRIFLPYAGVQGMYNKVAIVTTWITSSDNVDRIRRSAIAYRSTDRIRNVAWTTSNLGNNMGLVMFSVRAFD